MSYQILSSGCKGTRYLHKRNCAYQGKGWGQSFATDPPFSTGTLQIYRTKSKRKIDAPYYLLKQELPIQVASKIMQLWGV